ncbi:MAG: hypothetical protein OHK0015_42810 [Chloroflexi bacterium OHK40]
MTPRPPITHALAVLALGAVLGIALTWPMATRLATDLPGGAHKDGLEDAYQNVWNLWWTVEALRRPTNLWVTDRLFYPDGPNLLYHTLSPVNTLLAAPITALWGPIAGFNAVALASFALGTLGMWLLARRRAGPGPALLAGLVYAASPFHMAALVTDGQLQIFAHQWLPFYIYYLLEALAPHGRRRDALLAGVFLTLTAWTDWYYTLFLLIFSVGAVLWRLVPWPAAPARPTNAPLPTNQALPPASTPSAGTPAFAPPHPWYQHARSLALIALPFALGAGPLIAAMLLEAARSEYMTILPAADPARLSADLLAYVVPPRIHAFWGAAPWDWGVSYTVNRRFFVGLTVLALAVLACARRPAARPWGLAALAFAVLSLGSSLRVNGVDTGIPLPYALIADLPIVRLTRQPDRLNVLVTIALGVLAAMGVATLTTSLPGSGRLRVARRALVASAAALILLEYWPSPIVTRTPPVPPFLAALPRSDQGALIEYPFHPEVTYRDAERMLFQTVHGRPISGGYHSRAYPQPQLGLPALRDLRAGALSGDIVIDTGGWPGALRTLGYRYIIGYKQQPLGPLALRPEDEAPFRALVEAGLGVDGPIHEDEWLIAYAVPEASPIAMLQLRDGWGPLETAGTTRYRWLPEAAELGLITPTGGPYVLSFTVAPAGGPRTLHLALPWGRTDLPLASGPRRYRLLLDLPPGRTVVGLRTAEPPTTGQELEGNGDMRPLSARFERLSLTPLP